MLRAKLLIPLALLAVLFAGAEAGKETNDLWHDGEPEVILGAYFNESGTDTIWEEAVPDTIEVWIMMWNGGLRDEGPVIALEYLVDLPEGLILLREELPDYSNMAMGTADAGIAEAIREKHGDGLLVNKLYLAKTGDLAYDSRIRILAHPDSGFLRYVHRWGKGVSDIDVHHLVPQDAILNPKLSGTEFKPVKSGR
jgi:hypothetical protein